MKHSILKLAFFAAFLGFLASCSDDTTSPDGSNGTVIVHSELAANGTVKSSAFSGKSSPSAVFVDSLKVTYAAIVVSNLKMHRDNGDSTSTDSTDDGTIKTGPFLIEFDSSGAHVAVSSPIPAGTYDRIKFEIHKLRNTDDSLKALLSDFVTNDATMKFVGYVWVAGIQLPFTYYSRNTENIQVRFSPSVSIAENSTTDVTLQFDPAEVFSKGGVLDPRDPSNENDIRGQIHFGFKAMKK